MPTTSPTMSPESAFWLIAIVSALHASAIVGTTLVSIAAFKRRPDATGNTALYAFMKEGIAERFLAVGVIVYALIVLALAGVLSDGALALLASVGGYVLGRKN